MTIKPWIEKRPRLSWAEESLSFLRENHRFMTAEELAFNLGCSEKRIRNKLALLGLKPKDKPTRYDYVKYDSICRLAINKRMNWAIQNRIEGRLFKQGEDNQRATIALWSPVQVSGYS